MNLFDFAEVNARRDAAIALHEKTPSGALWLALAKSAAEALVRRNGEVTADDVRAIVGDPPKTCDGRIMGAVFHRSLFVRVGYVQSKRKINHAKMIAVFELRER